MNESKPRYWFRAKRYVWGWGLPATWQGWVAFMAWFAVVVAIGPWLAVRSTAWFVGFLVAWSRRSSPSAGSKANRRGGGGGRISGLSRGAF